MAGHPFLHTLFHSLASLGYIPFALTSALIAISTPYIELSPVVIILLAFIPPLTLFPLLCFSYRHLEKFSCISLTVQRAKTYIVLAGCGLCLLVAAQILLVHLVATPRNSRYNALIHTFSVPTLAQDRPPTPPSRPLQDRPWSKPEEQQQQQQQQHQQQHQQVLPSEGWVIPDPGSDDDTPSQDAILGQGLPPNAQPPPPPPPSDEASRTLFRSSTRFNRRSILPDEKMADSKFLRRRRSLGPRTNQAVSKDGSLLLRDAPSERGVVEVDAAPQQQQQQQQDLNHKASSQSLSGTTDSPEVPHRNMPIPVMAPIPAYLLPTPPKTDGSPSEPLSLSIDDSGCVSGPGNTPASSQSPPGDLSSPQDIVASCLRLGMASGGGTDGSSSSSHLARHDPNPSAHNHQDLTQLGSSALPTSITTTGTGFYSVAGFLTVLFIASQAALIGLLGMLFLGVLILTEFVLDREDDDPDPRHRNRLYWARGIGIALATVISAIHGSMLSTYVLLDGHSDWIGKAVIAAIGLYWPSMIFLMKRVAAPPPWE